MIQICYKESTNRRVIDEMNRRIEVLVKGKLDIGNGLLADRADNVQNQVNYMNDRQTMANHSVQELEQNHPKSTTRKDLQMQRVYRREASSMKKPLTPPTRTEEAPFIEAALVEVEVPVEEDEVLVPEDEESLLLLVELVPVLEGLFTWPSARTLYLISEISLPLEP
jgi:hypothetical protein